MDPVLATAAAAAGLFAVTNVDDNIAAYVPVFRAIGAGRVAVTVAVFAAGVAVWCLAGSWLVSHRKSTEAVGRYGQWLIPAAYLVIGLWIIVRNSAL
jgi:cadmium resistance protein CadD (predicted permease)